MQYLLTIFVDWWFAIAPAKQLLIRLIFLDIFAGMCRALIQGHLNSTVAWAGVFRKVLTLLLVGFAATFNEFFGFRVGETVAWFYCIVEGLSILENATASGLPVPKILSDSLSKLSAEKTGQQSQLISLLLATTNGVLPTVVPVVASTAAAVPGGRRNTDSLVLDSSTSSSTETPSPPSTL